MQPNSHYVLEFPVERWQVIAKLKPIDRNWSKESTKPTDYSNLREIADLIVDNFKKTPENRNSGQQHLTQSGVYRIGSAASGMSLQSSRSSLNIGKSQ